MDRARLGARERPGGRHGHQGGAARPRDGAARGRGRAGAARHHPAAQAGGLRQRPGRGWAPAGGHAGQRAQPLARRCVTHALFARAAQGAGAGGPARHRLGRPAGADAGRPRGARADRRGLGHRQGIPGARGLRRHHHRCAGRLSARAAGAPAPRPEPGRPAAETGAGGLAEPRAAALCAARGQEAADSPHVRAGRAEGDGPEAHPHRPRAAGAIAAGAMALSGRA